MIGKEKCKALKEIRKQIAENNDIKYVVEECQHKGECKGTCPKCEAEVRYLERELEKRRNLGKKVAIAGVSLSVAASFSACSPASIVNSVYESISDAVFGSNQISGDLQPVDYDGGLIYDPGYDLQGEPTLEYDLQDEETAPEYDYEGDESDPYSDPDCVDEDDYNIAGDYEIIENVDDENYDLNIENPDDSDNKDDEYLDLDYDMETDCDDSSVDEGKDVQ